MFRSYRVELNPNNKQATLLRKHVGAARFIYNWGLDRRIRLYEKKGKSFSYFDQCKRIKKLKDGKYPWLQEISAWCLLFSLKNLDTGFKNFYKGLRQSKKVGFPKFKSKWKSNRFYPSTKLCSVCGKKNKTLTLGDRVWVCKRCKTKHDRDVNAAVNLYQQSETYRESHGNLSLWRPHKPGSIHRTCKGLRSRNQATGTLRVSV